MDTDLPTALEARLFCTTAGKFVWVLLQPLFYALRPVVTYPKPPTALELFNTTVQMSFNVAVGYYLGEGGEGDVWLGSGGAEFISPSG